MSNRRWSSLGLYLLGVATVAAGTLDLIWGEFEPAHQPIQAWGDYIPGQQILAYITAVWLILAGAALLWRRTAGRGAMASAVIYFIFAMFWLPRLYTAPRVLGYRIGIYIGILGGMATQLIVVAGAVLVYASTAASASEWRQKVAALARWTFGLASVDFGLTHLTGVDSVTPMIPKWMPLSGGFWAVLTGVAFVLSGIAILAGILDILAARLLALMLLVFSALALAPHMFTDAHSHVAWGANAYNLAAVGAVWIFADSIASRRAWREDATTPPHSQTL